LQKKEQRLNLKKKLKSCCKNLEGKVQKKKEQKEKKKVANVKPEAR
jgi:hypothetical protein